MFSTPRPRTNRTHISARTFYQREWKIFTHIFKVKFIGVLFFLSFFFLFSTPPLQIRSRVLLSSRRDGHNATRRESPPPRHCSAAVPHALGVFTVESRMSAAAAAVARPFPRDGPQYPNVHRSLAAPARTTPSDDNDLNRRKLHALPCQRFTGEFHGSPCAPRPSRVGMYAHDDDDDDDDAAATVSCVQCAR